LDQLAEHVEELRQAGHLQQNGQSAEALPILDGVLAAVTDPTTRAYALVQRFGALINLGRVAELATAMSLASNAVRELPARSLINLGNLAGRREQPDAAVEHYREALAAYREAGDRNGEAVALSNLGNAERKCERYDSAEDYLTQALELNRELRKRHTEADALDNLGLLSTERGDGERAADYHRQALAIYRELGDRGSEVCAHNGLGEAAQVLGRFAEARDEHARALEIAQDPEIDDRSEQARAHTGLAEAGRGLGALTEAREHYLVAQGLWEKLGSPRATEIAEALAALGG
jgi:tetratricopeptide (TPR) repeat protein